LQVLPPSPGSSPGFGGQGRSPPLSFRSQAIQPPHPQLWAPSEGRDRRGQKLMEEKMRVLTINELLRMTRKELCVLVAHIAARLPTYREGSPGRPAALI